MKKEELIKFIEGELSSEREAIVIAWLNADERNMKYFAMLKALLIAQSMPAGGVTTRGEVNAMKQIIASETPWQRIYNVAKQAIAIVGLTIFILLIITNIHFYLEARKAQMTAVTLNELPDGYKHTIYTEKGVKARIMLPDSSRVMLNGNSKIVFPDRFIGPTREVFIAGEAYFEVTSDSLRPMMVSTAKNFKVEVRGTTFGIKAYDDDDFGRATLLKGRINLLKVNAPTERLHPGESYIIHNNGRIEVDLGENAAKRSLAWVKGKMIFENTPLDRVIIDLERWYGIDIIVKDPVILNYKITATFRNESITQIMDMLQYTSFIEYSMGKNQRRITLQKRQTCSTH
ncbi:MAG: DUF4974 domain-containing protein [Rikenellaceae bacterium]|nr:DUF4974 domain-containing protein [Rikenellaceae bacterium]